MSTPEVPKTARFEPSESARGPCLNFLETLEAVFRVRAVKAYRVKDCAPAGVPVIPCLDHEAKLHAAVPVHVSAYIEDPSSHDLHEVGYYPEVPKLVVDVVSARGEHTDESETRLRSFLSEKFPGVPLEIAGASLLRGDDRVAQAARAQITLREVLVGEDYGAAAAQIAKLKAVAALMEKESRVASWSVRTIATPVLAAAAFVIVALIEAMDLPRWLYPATLTPLGAVLLYFGLKAVHLTEMANRVWKRATEYDLILAERRRFGSGGIE